MSLLRRSGQAPCFFCGVISPSPEEWKQHNRSCWAEYAPKTHVVDPAFVEELCMSLHLRITCRKHRERIFAAFARHSIKTMRDILLLSSVCFDSLVEEIDVDIVASRLKQSRL